MSPIRKLSWRRAVICSMKVQRRALLLGVVRNAAEEFLKESKGQSIDLTSKNKPKREERETMMI